MKLKYIVLLIGMCFMHILPQELKSVLTVREVIRLFPKKGEHIERRVKTLIKQAKKRCKEIIAVSADQRSYANTVRPFDNVLGVSDFAVFVRATELLEMVSPVEDVREAAHEASVKLKSFIVDVRSSRKLYDAFKEYVDGNMQHENLKDEERYFIEQTMLEFKRSGLQLPDEILLRVKNIKKEISQLSLDFSQHIADDITTIVVSNKDALAGLDDDFIDALKQTRNGRYILGVDYPTYHAVMQNCMVSETRKALYEAFSNRAYPVNEPILKELIAKRDELATLLGYENYAQYDLENQMVGTPERAQEFLDNLMRRAEVKEAEEFKSVSKDLPEGVALIDGKCAPWDHAFVKDRYKKKVLAVDEHAIAEYFPMEKTIQGLLSIYEAFFSLTFEEVPVGKLWSNDVRLLQVYDDRLELLGYILLDLFPRANKYSHACNLTLVPAVYDKEGKPNIALSAIVANFPKATDGKPSLLTRNDVSTFFHEFGHALHGILGRTHVALLSGYETKMDFVEMPSQMLEEWLWDKEMLKKVSEHYLTGEPLPDALIEKILATKHFESGFFVQRQVFLAKLSLFYFLAGAQKDLQGLQQELAESILKHVYYVPENHMFASFGHLTEYAAKYYGYLWSKVFALDIFNEIKKHGLLNPEIGKKYVECIIGRGGSADPNAYIRAFLGREPNDKAFFADMGL
jgi:thimet oligopeptidase